MRIPKLIEDLNIVQKLSDLPNSSDGLSADELKAKFDEGANLIKNWLNDTLIPALIAEKLPFAPTAEIGEETIQKAIENVQAQVRDASTGTIVNGSVTREKLSAQLQSRAYGGRAWVSLNDPTEAKNPGTDFPVGQLWFRPGFTVENKAGGWVVSGCTISEEENKVTVTGDLSSATVTLTSSAVNLGQGGDRVYVLFDVEDKDAEIASLTAQIGSAEAVDATKGGVFTGTVLPGGTVTVKLSATWPTASVADGRFTITNFTVVNVDAILRQIDDAESMEDWAGYLSGLLPLTTYVSPEKVWMQVKSGQWWPMSFDPDQNRSNLFLQYLDGEKVWADKETAIANLGSLRIATGTYTGTGVAGTVQLPLAPKILFIHPNSGGVVSTTSDVAWDNPIVLLNGAKAFSKVTSGAGHYFCGIGLEEDTLSMFDDHGEAFGSCEYGNREGETYIWTAIY